MPHTVEERSVQDTWVAESCLTAIHDPVPAASESGLYGGHYESPHTVERDVQRALLSLPNVEFSSLHVHRLPNGVCLTGIVRAPKESKQLVERLAATVAGVDKVLNHLVVQCTDQKRS